MSLSARTRTIGLILFGVGLAVACSSSGDGDGGSGGGVCTTSCPKTCATDNDCPTDEPLCASFGSYGMACVALNAAPPAPCTSDSACDTGKGEACCVTQPGSTTEVCAPAEQCLKQCTSDPDCSGETPKCCTDYAQPFCTAAEECPVPCSQSSECSTELGELCCTTIHSADKQGILSSSLTGVCEPASGCPVACSVDNDCAGTESPLCCDGLCSAVCVKSCTADSQCDTSTGELCCMNPVVQSPYYMSSVTVSLGPPTSNSPSCATLSGCCATSSIEAECEEVAGEGNEEDCETLVTSACTATLEFDGGFEAGFDAGENCSTTGCPEGFVCTITNGSAVCASADGGSAEGGFVFDAGLEGGVDGGDAGG